MPTSVMGMRITSWSLCELSTATGKAAFNYSSGRGGPAYLSPLRERLAELHAGKACGATGLAPLRERLSGLPRLRERLGLGYAKDCQTFPSINSFRLGEKCDVKYSTSSVITYIKKTWDAEVITILEICNYFC